MSNGPKPKDKWDKADIIAKFISGVVLVMIAMVIKFGADEIAAAHRRGELVRSLLADLTTRDQQTRQDLALIALDHSLGNQNATLVIDIAERLVIDTTAFTGADRAAANALGSVAFRILVRRDPARADSVRKLLEQRFEVAASDSVVRAALRSTPDTASRSVVTPITDSAARAVADLLTPVSSRVVYIQFRGEVQRSTMEGLRGLFADAGFTAPGVEQIATPFSSSIRYFHTQDAALADTIAQLTREFIRTNRLTRFTLPVQDMSGRRLRAPRGQIEVWISVP